MNLYKLTLKDRYGEKFVVTLAAASLYDAMQKVELDPGWEFYSYSVLGVTI